MVFRQCDSQQHEGHDHQDDGEQAPPYVNYSAVARSFGVEFADSLRGRSLFAREAIIMHHMQRRVRASLSRVARVSPRGLVVAMERV